MNVTERSPRRRSRTLLVVGALSLLLVVGATSSWLIWRAARRNLVETLTVPQEKVVDISTLVTQVRELQRLETASMHVLHVGRVTQSYKAVPSALAGDEITFLAAGDVIAGIDLAELRREDVWRSPDGTLHMRLPRSRILVSRVDNKESRVLSRKTGMLRRADMGLESRARQHAEENIRAEALRKGILPLASRNAEARLADFLNSLGFEKVQFESRPPLRPQG